jgi:hypothetical protein
MPIELKPPDVRLYSVIVRYPGLLATPPTLDRAFVIPPRPGPNPAPDFLRGLP